MQLVQWGMDKIGICGKVLNPCCSTGHSIVDKTFSIHDQISLRFSRIITFSFTLPDENSLCTSVSVCYITFHCYTTTTLLCPALEIKRVHCHLMASDLILLCRFSHEKILSPWGYLRFIVTTISYFHSACCTAHNTQCTTSTVA